MSAAVLLKLIAFFFCGLGLTFVIAIAGICPIGYSIRFGLHSGPPREQDESYSQGWVLNTSGQKEYFRVAFKDLLRSQGTVIREIRRSGACYQYFDYIHLFRGWPFNCIEYFQSYDGRLGKARCADLSLLEEFPNLQFKGIIWSGLALNTTIWTIPFIVFYCFGFGLRLVARAYRGRCVKCGYWLKGLATARCPECGRAFDPGIFISVTVDKTGVWLVRSGVGYLVVACAALATSVWLIADHWSSGGLFASAWDMRSRVFWGITQLAAVGVVITGLVVKRRRRFSWMQRLALWMAGTTVGVYWAAYLIFVLFGHT